MVKRWCPDHCACWCSWYQLMLYLAPKLTISQVEYSASRKRNIPSSKKETKLETRYSLAFYLTHKTVSFGARQSIETIRQSCL